MKTAFLKRIVVKQSNQNDIKLSNQHDLLVLNKERVYLGRSSKDCDLVLTPKIISRKHVLFIYNNLNKEWNIECLNDKNGVFVNGKQLKKNQVKKLDDNCVISFGPTFLTNFVYQFTTKESSISKINSKTNSIATVSIPSSDSSFDSSIISLPTSGKNRSAKITNQKADKALPSNLVNLDSKFNYFTDKMNKEMNLDESKSNAKKIKLLKVRVKHLENKVNVYRTQCRSSRFKIKKMNTKLKSYQSATTKQRSLLKNAKITLNKERNKKKELQKQLADKDKYYKEFNNQIRLNKVQIKKDDILPTKDNLDSNSTNCDIKSDKINRIVQKYNELFSEDFTCGVCLELFLEPVSATCGHTFCKFCIVEWLKRNQNKRECPLCRTGFRGHFKNVVIENIIEKYLVTADKEVLETRQRLKNEREKVIEARKKEEEESNSNNENRRNRLLNQFDFNINALNRQLHWQAIENTRMINYEDIAEYDFFGNDSDSDEYDNDFDVFNDNLDDYQDEENPDEENDSNNDEYDSDVEYDIVIE